MTASSSRQARTRSKTSDAGQFFGARTPFAEVPLPVLEDMAEAGNEVRHCLRVLGKTNDNVVSELLRDQGAFYEWDHYPAGDVYDAESHSQYYYHAHADGERPGEHGHFHTFQRAEGMPKGIKPLAHPDNKVSTTPGDCLSHLVGIGMDVYGQPVSLFTTNRWVTDEVWYSAPDVIRMLEFFDVDLARPSWLINRWLSAMLRLFRPQIVSLLSARDERLSAHAGAYPDVNVFDDRRLEVTAEINISIDRQVGAIDAAIQRHR